VAALVWQDRRRPFLRRGSWRRALYAQPSPADHRRRTWRRRRCLGREQRWRSSSCEGV